MGIAFRFEQNGGIQLQYNALTSDVVEKFEKAVGNEYITTNKVIRYSYLVVLTYP